MEIILTIALLVGGTVAGLLWRKGSFLRAIRRDKARVQLEDALKHIYDCEYNRLACTLESVAGTLALTPDKASEVIARLNALQLVTHDGRELRLTEKGRDDALRVIRIHRLWERYLADETAVREQDWHSDADKKEHLLTPQEAGELAKRLGHPPFDPHGDPIPTEEGVIPAQRGKPLLDFHAGETLKVTHVEDEPEAVFALLVREKIFPDVVAKVAANSRKGLELETEGRMIFLSAIAAANVRAVAFEQPDIAPEASKTLLSLRLGESGRVIGISHTCRGVQRRRLMDLGIVPGTEVTAELQSVSGDPVGYNIRGATIALRRQQAEMVFIE
ncbi:MAG: metal-dependent transcriptional regulator [Ignavibacteriae bacterium]|nr:metal-dependent transcriptional regulator [Ignavibacteriota bacterium]